MRLEISSPRESRLSMGRSAPGPLSDGAITLRLPEAADVDRLARYGADKALLEGAWVGWPPRDADLEAWASRSVGEWLAAWTDEGGIDGGVLVADGLEPFVGIVFFVPWTHDVVELVYGVLPTVRGRGIASRIARFASDWALTEGDFARVELKIGESHAISRRVAENAGFQFEERFKTYIAGTGQTHVDTLYVRAR